MSPSQNVFQKLYQMVDKNESRNTKAVAIGSIGDTKSKIDKETKYSI